jgi:hypothetical protein
MNDELNDVRLYNGMFETAVTSAETSLSAIAEKVAVNQYSISYNNIILRVVSTNNPIASVYTTIEYVINESYAPVIAQLSLSKDATYEETYQNVPQAVLTLVHDVISKMIDDVVGFINNFQPS